MFSRITKSHRNATREDEHLGSTWQIEPAGVAGVLKEVDGSGEALDTVQTTFNEVKSGGGALLTADDRSVLSTAWDSFCKDRAEVPGKLMWVLNERCAEVSSAVLAINTGTVEMGDNLEQNRRTAKEQFAIEGGSIYDADGDPSN